MAAVDTVSVNVTCSGPGSIPLISRTKYNIIALTAGNFASQNGLIATLATTEGVLTNGIIAGTDVTVSVVGSSAYPGITANRGSKWILTAANAGGRKYTYTIPASPGDGEFNADNLTADLTGTNWAAYKAAFEAVAVDPFGGALTLLKAVDGGRRR